MPVYGLLKDHRMGTFLLRPSSVNAIRSPGNSGFRPTNFHSSQSSKQVKTRPTSASVDRNVVIAAYGTQVTLHRSLAEKRTDSRLRSRKFSAPPKLEKAKESQLDIHVPTAHVVSLNRQISSPVGKSSTTTSITGGVNVNESKPKAVTPVSDAETGEFNVAIGASQSTVGRSDIADKLLHEKTKYVGPVALLESCDTSPKFIDRDLTSSLNSSRRQTAWHRPPIEKLPTQGKQPSVANFIDIDEETVSTTQNERIQLSDKAKSRNPDKDITVKIPHIKSREASRAPNNSPDSIDLDVMSNGNVHQYFVNTENATTVGSSSDKSYLGRYRRNMAPGSTDKIREVWSARNKNEVSSRMHFSHESLRRPRSASTTQCIEESTQYEITTNLNTDIPQSSSTAKLFERKRETSGRGSRRRYIQRRKKRIDRSFLSRSLNSADFYREEKSNNATKTNALDIDDAIYVDCKSLIRQNHRPTTAIRYCKQDRATLHSITPCVRKAKVSHTTYIAMNHHEPTSPRHEHKNNQQHHVVRATDTPNLTVKAKSLSKLANPTLYDVPKFLSNASITQLRESTGEESKILHTPTSIKGCHPNKQQGTTNLVSSGSEKLCQLTSVSQLNHQEDCDEVAKTKYESTKENECTALLLLLQQEVNAESDETDSRISQQLPNRKTNLPIAKRISTLSRPHVEALEDASEVLPSSDERDAKKNKMIRKWLNNVEISPENDENFVKHRKSA